MSRMSVPLASSGRQEVRVIEHLLSLWLSAVSNELPTLMIAVSCKLRQNSQ